LFRFKKNDLFVGPRVPHEKHNIIFYWEVEKVIKVWS